MKAIHKLWQNEFYAQKKSIVIVESFLLHCNLSAKQNTVTSHRPPKTSCSQKQYLFDTASATAESDLCRAPAWLSGDLKMRTANRKQDKDNKSKRQGVAVTKYHLSTLDAFGCIAEMLGWQPGWSHWGFSRIWMYFKQRAACSSSCGGFMYWFICRIYTLPFPTP